MTDADMAGQLKLDCEFPHDPPPVQQPERLTYPIVRQRHRLLDRRLHRATRTDSSRTASIREGPQMFQIRRARVQVDPKQLLAPCEHVHARHPLQPRGDPPARLAPYGDVVVPIRVRARVDQTRVTRGSDPSGIPVNYVPGVVARHGVQHDVERCPVLDDDILQPFHERIPRIVVVRRQGLVVEDLVRAQRLDKLCVSARALSQNTTSVQLPTRELKETHHADDETRTLRRRHLHGDVTHPARRADH